MIWALLLALQGWAGKTEIYEKTKNEKTFTSQVRLVREIRGAWEVAFEKPVGIYSIPEGSELQNRLVEAQKNKTPVTVTIDEDHDRVVSVTDAKKDQNPRGK